jgi:hypothetical protein
VSYSETQHKIPTQLPCSQPLSMPVTDEDAALQAIATLESLSDEQTRAVESISQILHNDEPFVDIHDLFRHYNVLYFRGLLVPRVEVLWSPRLTLYVHASRGADDIYGGATPVDN